MATVEPARVVAWPAGAPAGHARPWLCSCRASWHFSMALARQWKLVPLPAVPWRPPSLPTAMADTVEQGGARSGMTRRVLGRCGRALLGAAGAWRGAAREGTTMGGTYAHSAVGDGAQHRRKHNREGRPRRKRTNRIRCVTSGCGG